VGGNKCDPHEKTILNQLDLGLTQGPDIDPCPSSVISLKISIIWKRPPLGFIKLNFDRASKGNLRPTIYGATFRDEQGCLYHIW